MPDVSLQVQGLDELQRRLDLLRTEQAQKILRKGLRAGGRWVQTEVAERAPVRPSLPSGTALPVGALKFDVILRNIYRGVPEGGAVVTVGFGKFTAHVARWVEFGHRLVAGGRYMNWGKRGKGEVTGRVWAHPFMRPAWEATENVCALTFANTVKAELDKLQTPGGK